MARGIDRFEPPPFGLAEAAEINELIAAGHSDEADERLRHLVHVGVPPSVLFEMAMELVSQTEAG